jgi:lipopolysaccharide heptosyltransferase I
VKLLLVRLSAMGDVIHALPLAQNAAAAGATVAWVVERQVAGVLEGNPHCARILVADTKAWRRRPLARQTLREIRALSRQMRAFAPDQTIDAQGLWKSALVARMAGAPVAGFAGRERREASSALLCSVRVTPSQDARHVVDRNLALLSAVGIPVAARAPDAAYLLARPSPEADAFLASVPRLFAVLHPGAGREDKTWGEERFALLARTLRERLGLHAVISWGPGDEDRAQRLEALLPGSSRPALLGFPGLARLYAASQLFVGGDTGPMHLADALGVPTVALFGPTDPERNGPYRSRRGAVAQMRAVGDDEVARRAIAMASPLTLTP